MLIRTESDHFPLTCELHCKFMPHSSKESVLRDINFTSYKWCTSKKNDFQEKLNDEYTFEKLDNNSGLLNQTPDLNNVDKIVTLLQESVRYWCSGMTVKPRQSHFNRQPPWYDEECQTIKKQKFKFLDMFAKTGSQFSFVTNLEICGTNSNTDASEGQIFQGLYEKKGWRFDRWSGNVLEPS